MLRLSTLKYKFNHLINLIFQQLSLNLSKPFFNYLLSLELKSNTLLIRVTIIEIM